MDLLTLYFAQRQSKMPTQMDVSACIAEKLTHQRPPEERL
jgi:hypothetical protein